MVYSRTDQAYPAILMLRNVRCVVVGGGKVAERKVEGLLGTGADICVISPALSDQLQEWKLQARFVHMPKNYSTGDLGGARFVFAATDDRNVNTQVYQDSIAIGAQVNVADKPELCTFTVPANLRRGDLTITISTGGTNPAIAKAIRVYLESLFGPEWQDIMALMGKYRSLINEHIQDDLKRTAFYQSLFASNVLRNFISMNEEEVLSILGKMLERLEKQ